MMTEILQHLDALHVELSTIDPSRDSHAAETVANIARDLQRLVASTRDHDATSAHEAGSTRHAA